MCSASVAGAQEKRRRLVGAEMGKEGKGQVGRALWVINHDKKFRFYSALESISEVSIVLAMSYISSESCTEECTVLRHLAVSK